MTDDTKTIAPQIGLVCLACPDYSEPIADTRKKRLVDDLNAADISFIDAGTIFREDSAEAAIEKLKANNIDGIMMALLSWCRAAAVTRPATPRSFHLKSGHKWS